MIIIDLGEHKPIMTGFVPLANFLLPNTSIVNGLPLECPISQHRGPKMLSEFHESQDTSSVSTQHKHMGRGSG